MGIVFKNNAKTTLASNLSNSATSATVTDGSVFPTLGAGEFFLITFDDGTNNEICKCTARSSNTLTIVRAQDNTSARAFSSGDAAEGRVTAGVLETIQENIAAKSANQTVYNATTASSATAYNIGIDPGVEANAMVFLDGVMQHHDTFSFSGSTLTFDAAPVDGTKLEVIVDNLINLQSSNLTVDTFTAADVGGSAQTDFTLSDTPAAETNLIVFVEGVFQDQDAYTISSNTLSITTGVIAGRGVTVYVINPVNIGTPSDGTITSAKLSGNLTLPGTLTVGANDVAFDSPTFVVDNSNSRVGLGTASPTVPVDIVGETKMSSHLTLGTDSKVQFRDTAIYINSSADGQLDLVADTEIQIAATTIDINGAINASGEIVAASLDISGDIDVDGTTNLDVVDIDGAVDMASTLLVGGTVLSTAAALVNSTSAGGFGFASNNTAFYSFGEDASTAGSYTFQNLSNNASVNITAMKIAADGKIGIGTATTNKIFNIADPAQGGETLKLHFEANSSADNWEIYGYDRTNSHYTNMSLGNSAVFIATDKKVGIGTTSPDSIVDIEAVHSQLRLTDSDDSKFVLFSYSGGKLLVRNNDTSTTSKQFTLTEDGDFGIGTHVPDSVLHIKDPTSDTVLTMEGGASDANCRINFQNSGGTFRGMLSYDTDDNNLQFNVNDAERMRITSAGVLSIGDASPESGDASAPTSLYLQGGEANMIIKNTDATSSSQRQGIAFLNSSGTRVGTITITSSATGYATSSDYRLKENVTDMTNATTRLKQLKPKRFNWIVDETNTLVDGFLAHEVSSIVPEAVTGEKDGDEMQGIDQAKLVPLLVKTIQELEARIKTLEDA